MKRRPGHSNRIDLTEVVVYGKVPPQARELEELVLGAIMLEKDAMDTALDYLTPGSFYDGRNAAVFEAAVELNKADLPIDIGTVVEKLRQMQQLDEHLTAHYVTTLTNSVVSGANLEAHCRILQEKFLSRELIRICGQMMERAYEQTEDVFDLIDSLGSEVNTLSDQLSKGEDQSVCDLMVEEMQRIMELRERDDHLTGVPTGFKPMDKTTGGWQDTDLVIIAARPSVGKTAFALNLARNAALHPHKPTPVGILSMEMSKQQLNRRLMSAESDIDLELLNNPKKLTEQQLEALYTNGVQKLSKASIHIDDTAALSILQAKAKGRKMKKKFDIGLLIVDYLQLMSGDTKSQNREQEISTISRGLKALAKELRIPIIALSQLSRDIEKRQGQEPRLSDLRESGAIEQDADMVIFLTRQDYQQADGQEWQGGNKADAHIKKHRNGALETLPFYTALNVQRWMTPLEWETYQQNRSMLQGGSFRPLPVSVPLDDVNEEDPF